jgi:hypothetical protein
MHDRLKFAAPEPAPVGFGWSPPPREGGPREVPHDSPECLAKRCGPPGGRATRHYVKHAVVGREAGLMFNPLSPAFAPDRRLGGGGTLYEFRPVSAAAFDLYLKFLAEGKEFFLRQAERER